MLTGSSAIFDKKAEITQKLGIQEYRNWTQKYMNNIEITCQLLYTISLYFTYFKRFFVVLLETNKIMQIRPYNYVNCASRNCNIII